MGNDLQFSVYQQHWLSIIAYFYDNIHMSCIFKVSVGSLCSEKEQWDLKLGTLLIFEHIIETLCITICVHKLSFICSNINNLLNFKIPTSVPPYHYVWWKIMFMMMSVNDDTNIIHSNGGVHSYNSMAENHERQNIIFWYLFQCTIQWSVLLLLASGNSGMHT